MSALGEMMPDMPPGAWLVPAGLLLLVYAGFNALDGRTKEPRDYHPLATLHGVVTGVSTDRQGVVMWLDTMPGTERVLMHGPHLYEADERLLALPNGARIGVDFDGYTETVWALERTDGGPGFGDAEIRPWLAEAQAEERRTSIWLLGAGLLATAAGIVFMARDSS